jgi:deoxycytidine triphosphate deaminase
MIVGQKDLKKLLKSQKIVENLSERELTNPEGAGFDIRVGEVYKISGEGFLGVDDRKTPDEKLVVKFESNKKVSIKIRPGDFYLVKTIEEVNTPDDMSIYTFARSTLFRSGISLLLTQTAPGYKGPLVFGLKNLGDCNFILEMGARIAHIQFVKVSEKISKNSLYRGQWQGGRVAAKKKEKQV